MSRSAKDIQEEIQEWEDFKKATDEAEDKKMADAEIADLKKELSKAKAADKPAKKPAAKKKAPAKKKKDEVFVFEGEEINPDDADYCERLLKAWKTRRAKAKKASRKSRTRSIESKVGGDIADAVEKAIDDIPAATIKKNPKAVLGKIERLNDAAKEFLSAFKAVLGKEFSTAEAKKEFEDVEKVINGLTKKYGKK